MYSISKIFIEQLSAELQRAYNDGRSSVDADDLADQQLAGSDKFWKFVEKKFFDEAKDVGVSLTVDGITSPIMLRISWPPNYEIAKEVDFEGLLIEEINACGTGTPEREALIALLQKVLLRYATPTAPAAESPR